MKITKVTAAKGAQLAKMYKINPDGTVSKTPAASLYDGGFEVVEFNTLEQLGNILDNLTTADAITLGAPKGGRRSGALVTLKQKATGRYPDAICRSLDYFDFTLGAGVLLLDVDFKDFRPANPTGHAMLSRLRELIPELADVAMLWRPSSSSNIFNGQDQIAGIRGQHIFVHVSQASDIKVLGRAIADRLWLAGEGYCEVAKNGAILEKTLVDSSVHSPERLVYCAGAVCQPPLHQIRPPERIVSGSKPLDVSMFAALTEKQKRTIADKKKTAREAVKDEADRKKANHIDEQTKHIKDPEQRERAREALLDAIDNQVLTPDFRLRLTDGEEITVGDILSNPAAYHWVTMFDPIEPSYGGSDSRIAMCIRKHNGVVIHSFAHGGRTFTLEKRRVKVDISAGELNRAIQSITFVCKDRLYRRGSKTVISVYPQDRWETEGKIKIQSPDSLRVELGDLARFYRPVKTLTGAFVHSPADPSTELCRAFIAAETLQNVRTVIDYPVIAPDGRIISEPGLDEKTGVLIVQRDDQPFQTISQANDTHERQALAVAAYIRIYKRLFAGFRFESAQDLTVAFTALLSALLRPLMQTPAFLVTAPIAGSGKTHLIEVIAYVVQGKMPSATPLAEDENEVKKMLFAVARAAYPIILFDNIKNGTMVRSTSLAPFLTAPVYEDRILGQSTTEATPTTACVFLTGNNVSVTADLGRRFLSIRIDPRTDSPHTIKYATRPLEEARKHRQEIIADCLTIVKAAMMDGISGADRPVNGFEVWDVTVRSAVRWLSKTLFMQELVSGLEDNIPALTDDIEISLCKYTDPESERDIEAMELVYREFGEADFSAADIGERYLAICNAADGFDLDDTSKTPSQREQELEEARQKAERWRSAFLSYEVKKELNTKSLGHWLRANIDRHFSGIVVAGELDSIRIRLGKPAATEDGKRNRAINQYRFFRV